MDLLKIPEFLLKNRQGGVSVLYLALAAVYLAQNNLLYFPEMPGSPKSFKQNSPNYRSPKDRNIPFHDVFINTEDGVKLHGWFLKQEDSTNLPTIVFFHENAGNIGTRLDYLAYYYFIVKVNVLIVAYRGYSESEGQPSEPGLQKDAVAILKYAFNHPDINPKTIYTHGRSLGGATSIYGIAKGKFEVAGIILENTFTSIEKMIFHISPTLGYFAKFLLKNHWNTDDMIGEIKSPMLFIKSMKDELVPPNMMAELKNKAIEANFKEEYVIEEGDHNSNWMVNEAEYFEKIKNFISKALPNH